MDTILKHNHRKISDGNYKNPKLGFTISLLIIIINYLTPWLSERFGIKYVNYVNFLYLYTILSYTIVILSILIIVPKGGLAVFRDYFTIGIIIISCFYRVTLGGRNEFIYRGVLIALGLILLVFTVIRRDLFSVPRLKSFLVGLTWSVATIAISVSLSLLLNPERGILPTNIGNYVTYTSLFQLSFVTVLEETYFRGLLFGCLIMWGFSENIALLLQALLFWGIHYLKLSDPVLFWVIIPLITISVTLVIKKSHNLYSSIMIHTLNNVFSSIIVALF